MKRENYFMKNLSLSFVLAFGFFFVQSCATNTVDRKNLQREWMLTEFQNFSKEQLVASKASINLVPQKEKANQYSGYLGCNRMFFQAKFAADGQAEFSKIGSTMMYCDKNMEVEGAFGKMLPEMKSYKVEGHHLILSDGQGNQMKFVAADWD